MALNVDPWASWTDDALIEYEQLLYDQEVDGSDNWEERDAVLWEMNWRGLMNQKQAKGVAT